ncbi:MAG: hypothetical protein JSW34_04345 [Candidatus Zixiibacteriota bacterium]|nr:MAG: hypothetical protein JSW34_04345 [candidate division Zixibacteria bacterium]
MRRIRRHGYTLIVFTLITGLGSGGCSVSRMAHRGVVANMVRGMSAYDRETDLELAESAAAGQLKLLEGLLETDPDNSELLVLTAQGFARYTYGFVEPRVEDAAAAGDTLEQRRLSERAVSLYGRAQSYAVRALAKTNEPLAKAVGRNAEELEQALQKAAEEDVPALFWLAFSGGNSVRLSGGNPHGLADLARVSLIMRRVLKLDETYYFGGAHLFFGVYYSSLPALFGGDPAKARQHFARAIEISEGRYLMARYLMARHYCALVLDEVSLRSELEDIISTPEDRYPQQNLANQIAKQRARRLLATVNPKP